MKVNWKKVLPHVAAVAIIFMINIAYFFPQLSGKVVQSSDIVQSKKATAALKVYNDENDKTYLWNPSQFGGMPILAGAPGRKNIVYNVYSFFTSTMFPEPLGLYIAGCLMSYFLLVLLGVNSWHSLFFSIAMVLTTSNVILWEAGHNSKIRTLIFTPLLIAGVLSIFEYKKYLIGFITLALGFSMSIYTRHPQMTYYIMLVFMIYGFVFLYQTIKSKDWAHFGKGVVLVIFALVLGLATTASKTWSMYDYSEVTMRGKSILKSESPQTASSSEVDGLAWDYAMQWSNDYRDLMATYIPGFVGGGAAQKVSKNSATFKTYQISEAPLYWGQLPFTVGPMYIGASIIFLFVLGLMWVKGNIKWWLGFGALFMLLLSMGRYFEVLNRFIFDYFPLYSKFRAPQSVLNTSSFFIVVLAALAVKELFNRPTSKKKSKKKKLVSHINEKSLLIGYAICGGCALIIALLGPSLFDFSGGSDSGYIQQGVDVTPFIADRKSLMTGDAWRTFLIVTSLASLFWAFLKNKINKNVLTPLIGLIILFDIIGVDRRYLSSDDFVKNNSYAQSFEVRPVDRAILNSESDRSKYRVHDITSYKTSESSLYHNTTGGYSAVKMQRAEDLIQRHLSRNNMAVLNMLNTKYFIVNGQDGNPTVQSNPGALGTSWFVSEIRKVQTPNEEIDILNSINTADVAAVLDSEFPGYLDNLNPRKDSTSIIQMTEYEPDVINYKSQNKSESLAVFSEAWYGPNKGWQAYIDGEPVPHIRANYFLRALRIPAGSHEIRFEFKPKAFYLGEKISFGSSAILLLLIVGVIYKSFKEKQEASLKTNA